MTARDDTAATGLYDQAARTFGPAIARLAAAYETDANAREDLVQDIHVALWRSLSGFDGRASLRTFVYRVAHNVAASHVRAMSRRRARLRPANEAGDPADGRDGPHETLEARQRLAALRDAIRALPPLDGQVALLYLEEVDAAGIAEITGLTAGAVATRIHRIKAALATRAGEVSR